MFEVRLTDDAERDLKTIARADRTLYARVAGVLGRLEVEYDRGKPLVGPLKGWRSFRVGDLRVLYEIHRAESQVLVVRIAHRRNVYDI